MPYRNMSLDELARHIGMDVREVRRLADRGTLPGQQVGGEWRFHRAQLLEWLQREMHSLDPADIQNLERAMSDQQDEVMIGPLIPTEGVELSLPARSKSSVLRELVNLADRTNLLYDPAAHTIGWFANTGGTYGWQWHIHDIATATTGSPITPSQQAFALMTMTPTTGYQSDAAAFVGESYDPTLSPQWALDVIDPTTFTLIERLPDTGGSGTSTYYAFTHKRLGAIYEHWFVDMIAGEAVILIWERVGVVRNNDTVCNFDTITSLVNAATLAGMEVTAVFDGGAFTETVAWAATSATAGEAVGTGWSLACDGNTGPLDDAVWTFSFTGVGLPLTQLILNVEPAGCVFDTVRSISGSTPGSAGGGAFNALSGLEGCWITATYSKLALKVPYTISDGFLDLYLIATIDFAGTPPSADFTFSQDHDTVTSLVCPITRRRYTIVNVNMRRR